MIEYEFKPVQTVQIAPLVRRILTKGVGDSLGRGEPQYYALQSIIIDRIVNRAYSSRVPYKPSNREDPYSCVGAHMAIALEDAREKDSGDRFKKPVYEETHEIYDEFNSYFERSDRTRGGIATAVRTMTGLMRLVPELVGRKGKPTHDQVFEVLKNSYPFAIHLASRDMRTFAVVTSVLDRGKDWFVAELFKIEQRNGRSYVRPTKTAEKKINAALFRETELVPEMENRIRLGCPALVNFGDGSAIKKLWDWHLEIAEKLYEDLYPG